MVFGNENNTYLGTYLISMLPDCNFWEDTHAAQISQIIHHHWERRELKGITKRPTIQGRPTHLPVDQFFYRITNYATSFCR